MGEVFAAAFAGALQAIPEKVPGPGTAIRGAEEHAAGL